MAGSSSSPALPAGGGDDPPTYFSLKDMNVLSTVRTAKYNTCVYRAFCDAADARARMMAKTQVKSETEHLFSATKLWVRENYWTLGGGKRKDFMTFYLNRQWPLPMRPQVTPRYKLTAVFRMDPVELPDCLELVKECLHHSGPVVGGFPIFTDYVYEGPYLAIGEDLSTLDGPLRGPEGIDDLVPRTPLSPSDEKPPEILAEEAEAAAKAASAAAAAAGRPNQTVPPNQAAQAASAPATGPSSRPSQAVPHNPAAQAAAPPNPSDREFKCHAVCIVGYCTENGADYFIVQENQGRKAWEAGFRKVAMDVFHEFYLTDLVLVNRN